MSMLRFKPQKTTRDIDRCVRMAVQAAGKHIPVYRSLLRRTEVCASSIRGARDLSKLPVLEKEWLFHDADALDRLDERIAPSRCTTTRTGGYTGLPVMIYMSRAEVLFRRFQLLTEWQRIKRLPIALRIADVGSWIENDESLIRVRRGPISILRVSNALPIDEQVRLIAHHRPHVVSGYPTTTVLLAEEWKDEPGAKPPRLIATRGETLYDSDRRTIARGFNAKAADFYNCEETGNVASECPADPGVLHVNTDACLVEVVDDQWRPLPAGSEGGILVTSLFGRTMPFIRYFVGDRGTLLPQSDTRCDCGSRRPKMRVIEGRDDDFFIMPDGTRLSPRIVATTVKRNIDATALELGRVRLFSRMQIVQDQPDHATVKVVRDGPWPDDLDAVIASKLAALHPALRCTTKAVENIPAEPSGKLKKVLRRLQNSTDATRAGR